MFDELVSNNKDQSSPASPPQPSRPEWGGKI